jgi:hypothetical protein
MKRLRITATVTAVLGFISFPVLILLYLALADIAHQEPDTVPEWRIAGICLIILSFFLISTFVTIGFIIKSPGIWKES